MDRNEAHAALDGIRHTQGKLAERSQWPLWRHGLFGLSEGILVFGISLPFPASLAAIAITSALVVWIIHDDKKRYGMFVSGFRGRKPRLAVGALIVVLLGMCALSLTARHEPVPAPAAMLAALVTIIACTIGSVWWQKLYQAELREGVRP